MVMNDLERRQGTEKSERAPNIEKIPKVVFYLIPQQAGIPSNEMYYEDKAANCPFCGTPNIGVQPNSKIACTKCNKKFEVEGRHDDGSLKRPKISFW